MPQAGLHWLPHSYYKLRNPLFAGLIQSVSETSLRGSVMPLAKLKVVNGQLTHDPSVESAEATWDLAGNCHQDSNLDLMELIRP